MSWPTYPIFDATPPRPKPVASGWTLPAPSQPYNPVWRDDVERKKRFAAYLAKGQKPYDAAIITLDGDQAGALWAIANWLHDPVVLQERETVENSVNLLDKDGLSAKLLRMADEKVNGQFIHELKDRTALLRLYAEIQGMMPKTGIDLSKNTVVNNNEMRITFVEPDDKRLEPTAKIIEHKPIDHENALAVNLKLVG